MSTLRAPDIPWPAVVALVAGAAIRLAALPLPGTSDVDAWKTWSYVAATEGAAHVYGDEFPPVRHVIRFGELEAVANYPPLAIVELAVIGRAYSLATGGAFPDSPALTMTIRGAIVLADAAVALLLFGTVWTLRGRRAAWWAAAAFWISPAVLIATTLGYIDVFFALPAVAALVAASWGRPFAAGALFAAAVMTKPQAVFVAPAVALALLNIGEAAAVRRRLLASLKGGILVVVVLTLPVVFAGSLLNLLRAMASTLRHDMLSGNACNLWWIAGYLFDLAEIRHAGTASSIPMLADIVPISTTADAGYPNARLIGIVLLLGTTAWALWIARRARDLGLFAALGGFVACAYFILSAQVHENHFFVVIPLLVLAATLRRPFLPILTALGTVHALNLYLFYGVGGEGAPAIARTITVVDSTVLLSIVSCAVFAWFAVVFERACRPSVPPGGAV